MFRSGHDVAIADEKAYKLGRRGVRISSRFLLHHLRGHNSHALEVREQQLNRRINGRGAQFHHSSGIFFGVLIFVAALFVDYNIIHEFWTRLLSNEFGEVPPSLATTVAAKSLQVLFATLAVHYLISHIGHGGRIAYSLFIFLLTVTMVMGIGLLWANNSLPEGAKVFGFDVNESARSIDSFMKSLGVQPPRKASMPAEVKMLKRYEIFIWLFSLGTIFLIVASIGAMALHSALRGMTGMTGGALYDNHGEARRGNHMRDQLQRARLERQRVMEDEESFRRAKIADFVSSYSEGVLDGRFSAGRAESLIKSCTEAAEEVENGTASGSSADEEDNVVNMRRQRDAA